MTRIAATRIGLLGLGRMGAPILARLVDAGLDAVGFDPAGGSPRFELAAIDVLITVLPGRRDLADAAPGFLGALRAGAVWLDLTSGDPSLSRQLAAAYPEVECVGAPMGGSPDDAANGTLTFFVGGAPAVVGRVLPILDLLGRVERAGDGPGDGQTVKLLVNLLWFGQAVAVTEAMLLGDTLGVAPGTLRDILPRTAAGSRFVDDYLDRVIAGDDVPNFGIDRVVEELDTLDALAGEGPFELSRVVADLHRQALERFGPVDGELLVARLLRERAGG